MQTLILHLLIQLKQTFEKTSTQQEEIANKIYL